MIKITFSYNHDSARLSVDGLPDKSLGQSQETIGILSSWKLQLVGFPELEGQRNHLESLISVIFPYVRHSISGITREFCHTDNPVHISPSDGQHLIRLSSSKKGVNPLEIKLDDAELADLVRCLDDLIMDPRVNIDWNIPPNKPLDRRQISKNLLSGLNLSTPLIGITSFLFIAFGLIFIPIPEPTQDATSQTEFLMKDK